MAIPHKPQPTIGDLTDMVPEGRIAALIRAAGGDTARALDLHWWNEQVTLALWPPLQRVELGLRTRVHRAFAATFGPAWFADARFRAASSHVDRLSIAEASRRLMAEGRRLDAAGLIDKASLGLWVGLLRPAYNPLVWSGRLRTTFPAMPVKATRQDLANLAAEAGWLRNRLGHHELVIHLDLSGRNTRLLELLEWLDPAMAAEINAQGAVQKLLRVKP